MKEQANRYGLLDGIRGVAALLVMTRHTEMFWGGTLFRSYLAVDLFFILSGFVIASAYESRLKDGSMTIGGFFVTRVIRLYPVFLLSFLLSLVHIAGVVFLKHGEQYLTSQGMTTILLTAFLIPFKLSSGDLFQLNVPYWSLFYEIVINLVYALLLPVLTRRTLGAILVALAALISYISVTHHQLNLGFTWGTESVITGLCRAAFGIFFGVLLFRERGKFARFVNAAWMPWLALVVSVALLASPSFGAADGFFDIFAVVVVFPCTVMVLSQWRGDSFRKTFVLLGAASYPIYVLHYPLAEILRGSASTFISSHAPASGVIFVLFIFVAAIAVDKFYDRPIRAKLSARFLKKKSLATAASGVSTPA
ncbi:acyltransferase family protein [Paraburkholderia domus]|uniref:acyltransferase family protein n=1 Tax=Paraburkholderia domus TaxID=2793075 RepID=UPI0019148AC3|nr:acyltransferase [Paraburkholderia domus]MBK5061841.1 acyltransferase [Burkholderia sp. R-70199]CAE6901480.1 hypothetical protein R70199_03721 [Paraburkholderia domus]